jgi:hypothetical protein
MEWWNTGIMGYINGRLAGICALLDMTRPLRIYYYDSRFTIDDSLFSCNSTLIVASLSYKSPCSASS